MPGDCKQYGWQWVCLSHYAEGVANSAMIPIYGMDIAGTRHGHGMDTYFSHKSEVLDMI